MAVTESTVKLGGESAVEAVPKGTTYRMQEAILFGAMAAAFTAIGTALVALGQGGAGGTSAAAATAVTTFESAAASYLSTVTKTL